MNFTWWTRDGKKHCKFISNSKAWHLFIEYLEFFAGCCLLAIKGCDTMKQQYIELLQSIRSDSYRLGYIEGEDEGRKEYAKQYERLIKELNIVQKRAAWLQDKLTRTKENYEGQIKNLQNKINYYEELERRC